MDGLDDSIKIIRSTIYALHQRPSHEDTGLRARLVAETGQAAEALGFTPALRMTSLPDTLVTDDVADQLLSVLREALANAARHAHATAVDVTAEATATHLRLRVADNGTDPAGTRGTGLANLQARATDLGGTLTLTLTPNQPAGTVLHWAVPLPADNG